MRKWKQAWDGSEVGRCAELVLPVAVDDRNKPVDWVMVSVVSEVSGQKLGEATGLVVSVYDSAARDYVAQRIARNVDGLVRGIGARLASSPPKVRLVEVPPCAVSSQRSLYVYGRVVERVVLAAGMQKLDETSDAFLAHVSHASRALFAHLRQEVAEQGARDVAQLMCGADACRAVLQKFVTVPSFAAAPCNVGSFDGGRRCAVLGVGDCAAGGREASGLAEGGALSEPPAPPLAPSGVRVATWNVAGGLRSAQAPQGYNIRDQRYAVTREILRWEKAYGCDVVALQECEAADPYVELAGVYDLAAAADAGAEGRGYVQVYVRRRAGVAYDAISVGLGLPCVLVRVSVPGGRGGATEFLVLAVHLPAGSRPDARQALLGRMLREARQFDNGSLADRVLLLGDLNVNSEAEAVGICPAPCP